MLFHLMACLVAGAESVPLDTTVARTVAWYRAVHEGASPLKCCLADLEAYQAELKIGRAHV